MMPTLSTTNNKVPSVGLEEQAIDDHFVESKYEKVVGTLSRDDVNDEKIFNFEPLDQKSEARLQVCRELSADLPDQIPCSSSSTTSSSESPSSISVPSDNVDLNSKSKQTDTTPRLNNNIDLYLANNIISNNNQEQYDTCGSGNEEKLQNCYNPVLDDEIRARLDKLNALSDLINSLERQFDQANNLFREILNGSTCRLSSIAKKLGNRSISLGRDYYAARVSVEQSQSGCQKACVQFEQANNDHQFAREAIKEAENKLRKLASRTASITDTPNSVALVTEVPNLKPSTTIVPNSSQTNFEQIDLSRLNLCEDINDTKLFTSSSEYSPDGKCEIDSDNAFRRQLEENKQNGNHEVGNCHNDTSLQVKSNNSTTQDNMLSLVTNDIKLQNAAELSNLLNAATTRLMEADQKRRQSEKLHLDQANKLMIAQENLQRLEREHGNSIRRSQLYFDEANRFKARLNSIKSDIRRISNDILAAKQAYARTLSELEQFSEDLHVLSATRNANNNNIDEAEEGKHDQEEEREINSTTNNAGNSSSSGGNMDQKS